MKQYLTVFTAITLALLAPMGSAADATIRLGTALIPHMVEGADRGVFVDVTKEIARRANLDVSIEVSPRLRLLHQFQKEEVDVMFPALDVDFSDVDPPIKSRENLFTKRDYIFTRTGDPIITSGKQLEGLFAVGIVLGYPYCDELLNNTNIKFSKASTDYNSFKQLLGKRVDAVVMEETTAIKVIESMEIQQRVDFDLQNPISALRVFYAFQDSDNGKLLEAAFSKALKSMKDDGSYQQMIQSLLIPAHIKRHRSGRASVPVQ